MLFLVIGLVLAAAVAVGLFTTAGSNATPGRPTVGSAAPAFSLPRLGGGAAVGLPQDGAADNRPAVVLFYASDCIPCRTEIPALAAYNRRHPHTGVALLGVAASDPFPAAFARSSGITFPVGLDTSLDVTVGKFAFNGLPEAVFVTSSGTIESIHYGAITVAQLKAGERKLLG